MILKDLEILKEKIEKDKPFYLIKQSICSNLKNSSLKNILLQTYELGIPAELLIHRDLITKERKKEMANYLRTEFLMDKNAAKLIVKHWCYLLDIDDYDSSLINNSDLANEFLNDNNDTTQSKVRLVGYKDIEVNNDLNKVESKLLSDIFLEGLKTGNLDKVKEAVENGFSIDFKDKGNRDALMIWITKKGYLDILKYLVLKGLDILKSLENGRSILMYVAKTEYEEMFEYLLSLKLDINHKDNDGKTVLMYATEHGYLPLIKKTLKMNADINIGTKGYQTIGDRKFSLGKTALMYSVASKKKEVVEYLLTNNADIFATKGGLKQNESGDFLGIGKNVVMYAVEHGDLELVKFLVSKGTPLLEVKDEFNNSSLVYAVIKKDIKMIKYLIDKKISINTMNRDNLNPLIYAIKINEINIVKLLVSEGAIISGSFYYNNNGNITKPIHYAIKEGNDAIIKYLLSKDIEINEQDTEGKTPLMYAIEKQNIKLIKQFIVNKVDIEITDNNGNNAFWYASKENNNKIITILENYLKKDYR